MAKYVVSRAASTCYYCFLTCSVIWLTIVFLRASNDNGASHEPEVSQDAGNDTNNHPSPSTHDRQLGIASHVYLVSLPQRQDRREQMEFLRTIQGLTWSVIDAIPSDLPPVNRILDWVVFQRTLITGHIRSGTASAIFRWPTEINALSVDFEPLEDLGADLWMTTTPPTPKSRAKSTSGNLTCAVEDYSIPAAMDRTPDWMVLSPAKIACWYSHVSVIRQFMHRPDPRIHDVAVILEDDIDMEKDIKDRVSRIWSTLPSGWDIVFLGHCWSNESSYPALTDTVSDRLHGTNISTLTINSSVTHLHPSSAPKCTHAYAISHSGARRILQHLRYPPFAYSRALDQALAWLIRTGRLRSYSVVPSVIIQRKTVSSDILPGMGSAWREGLQNGVFGS